MNTPQACLPMPIDLGAPPLRRVWHRFAQLLHDVRERARRAARDRAERRLTRSQHALLASLDAHTLRDIGLGDWAYTGRDDGPQIWGSSATRGF